MFYDSASSPVFLPRLCLFEDGYTPVPIRQSLNGLTRPIYKLQVILEDCTDFVENSAQLTPPMDEDNALAIAMYSYEIQEKNKRDENIYARLNRLLRDRSDEIHQWKHYVFHLTAALRKMPVFNGIVFRGINVPVSPQYYTKARKLSWNAFTSTTASEEIGKKFIQGMTKGSFFSIKVKRGRLMRGLTHFESEEEVLLESNTEFIVTACVELNGIMMVQLEEQDSNKLLVPADHPLAPLLITGTPAPQAQPSYPPQQPQSGYPPTGYPPPQPQKAGYPPQQAPGYPPQQAPAPAGYPPQTGYPPQGYPPQGYPPAGYPPPQPTQGYPPAGYPPPQQTAYPPQSFPTYPSQPGYPPQGGYMPPPPTQAHAGVRCDACEQGITGIRVKCWVCWNYDLCQRCHSSQKATKYHLPSHPVEAIQPGGQPGRCVPRPPEMIVGKRVRRGRDWKWDEQDSQGEGTTYKSDAPGWVTVTWDSGKRANYRWGAEGCYDLLILPTASTAAKPTPTPTKPPGPATSPVVAKSTSAPQTVVVRTVNDLVGKRVKRGKDWKWGNQGNNTDGTIYGLDEPGWVKVVWDNGDKNQYRFGADGSFDLSLVGAVLGPGFADSIASQRPTCQQMVGKRVRRGPDWKWGTQDGNGPGTVTKVEDEGVLNVRWDNGNKNQYRWGHEGKYDLRVTDDPEPSETDNPVSILWKCLVMLHKSLRSEYLGEISLSTPSDLQGVYTAIFKYECAIRSEAQEREWVQGGKRKHWEKEMRGPTCNVAHAATCLLAVERYIRGSCQTPGWKEERKPWCALLLTLGGEEMQFPTGLSGGQDVDKLVELLAKVLASNS
jgi:hypothetical protein